MANVEVQEQSANSMELETASMVPELKVNDKKLSGIGNEESDSIAGTNTAKEKDTFVKPADIGDTVKAANCEPKQNKKIDEVIKKDQENTPFQKSKANLPTVEEPDTVSSVQENDSKSLNSENTKEFASKGGNNLKRKRRTLNTQEQDSSVEESSPRSKRKKIKNTSDRFCWRCHKECVDAQCSACPRSWHRKCIGGMQPTSVQNWICAECAAILKAENAETRSTAMAQLSVDQLCLLLRHVVERMRDYPGSEPFWEPVDLSEVPNYLDYVVKPMDLSLLESNVRAKLYGSTDAFMADAKWIQHNCIVFNTCGGVYTDTSKLTNAAKQIIKLARQEVSEIEACPDCFAHGRNLPRPHPSWFIEPCRRPHPLVWAKLKGFPFWPAKAMPRINTQGFVDVRFFGEHDRAWVSPRDVYLYSEDPPAPLPRKRKPDMDECVREITRHCRKLELVFGQFKFAPPKVQYNPHDPMQIKLMLPNYDPLQPNNFISPLFSAPKKRITSKRKAPLAKAKSQNDSQKSDSPDLDNKSLIDCDISMDSETEETETKKQGQEKSKKSNQAEVNPVMCNDLKSEGESLKKEEKDEVKKVSLTNECVAPDVEMKEVKIKPGTSKPDDKNSSTTVKNDAANTSVVSGQSKTLQKAEDAPAAGELPKEVIIPLQTVSENIQPQNKEPLPKNNSVKVESVQNISNAQKPGIKATKTITKVYKPKTRMVDKVNAERALKSISANEQTQKPIGEDAIIKLTPIQGGSESKDTVKNSTTNASLLTPTSTTKSQIQPTDAPLPSQAITVSPKSSADQSLALFLVVNSGVPEPLKQATPIADKERSSDALPGLQQLPKDKPNVHQQKKESRAKKSFPNKPRSYPQAVSRPSPNLSSNTLDSMVYIPAQQTENSLGYQMVPPEAGPVSARLYHGAQDLAGRMAQLMEEAYKEAAQENQNSEDGSVENHQATIHFLRLQIERMRWQHQQQLAELKHNTDRILREMRTSLEAERLRAIEETRREAEQEKIRCIEEIKRKQWCAVCGREAVFYCCWNTAYCDYPCQQCHWPTHMRTCAQQPSFTTVVTSSAANTNQQQVMPRLMINTQHASNAWRA